MIKRSMYILSIVMFTSCLRTPESEQTYRTSIYYPELSARISGLSLSNKANNWLYIIDFGNKISYDSGYIDFAENIEFRLLVDSSGHVVNNGRVIKERYDNQWPFVIYSSSNDTIAFYIARLIQAFGFQKIYYYEGGIKDWYTVNGDYLCINYSAFKTWYDANFPFGDSLQSLVDIHPSNWFEGSNVLAGHIPGALNIPTATLADTSGNTFTILNRGLALREKIPDPGTRIILYYSEGQAERAYTFIRAARELGYYRIYLFKNGYNVWLEEGNSFSTE